MVYSKGTVLEVKQLSIINNVGGTTIIPNNDSKKPNTFYAKVTDTFEDSETGQRYVGELFREADEKITTEAGTTGYTPEHFLKYGSKMYDETLKAFNEYDPKRVYFGEFDVIKEVK